MTVSKCLTAKAEAGKVDKKKAANVVKRYEEAVKSLMEEGRLSRAEAEQKVIEKFSDDAERDLIRKKRMAMDHTRIALEMRQKAVDAEKAGVGVDVAMHQVHANDPRERAFGATLDARIGNVRNAAHRRISDFIEKYRTKKAGFTQEKAGLEDVMRELRGESTSNASAKIFAEAITDAIEYLRLRFNAAGGDIVERQDWGFFQTHNQRAIAKVDKEEWVQFVYEELDLEKILDVNGHPMTQKQIRVALREMYDSVVSGGLSDIVRPASTELFGSAVNKRANHRFLVFKNADAWLKYQRKFGNPNLYDNIISSISALSRDVALQEILGPYADAMVRYQERLIDEFAAKGAISKKGRAALKLAEGLGQHRRPLTALYNTVRGRTAIAENNTVATIFQGNRSVLMSALLSSAWLTALGGDLVTGALTARMNGFSGTRVIANHLKMFTQTASPATDAANRQLALQLGFGAEGAASRALGLQRIIGEVTGPEITERLADISMRTSFLTPWTEKGRWNFQIEMLGHITRSANKTFEQLDPALRNSFIRHGISPEDWELIRTTTKWIDPETKAEFIRAEDVARGEFGTPAFDAANKLQQAISAEKEMAIISMVPQVRAFLTAGAPAGTFWGDVMRNSAVFKGFPMSILFQHVSRLMAQQGPMNKLQYAAWLFIGLTMTGAMSEQLVQIARGRDPLDMAEPSFWSKATMRGGALGLFGDIIFADQNRWGGGLWDGLLGPVALEMEDITKLTLGNVQELLAGEDTHAGRELSRFIESYTPGRTLWYSRLVFERYIFDTLDRALDPQAHETFRAMERRAREDHKQKFFWRPGRREPSRMPQFP